MPLNPVDPVDGPFGGAAADMIVVGLPYGVPDAGLGAGDPGFAASEDSGGPVVGGGVAVSSTGHTAPGSPAAINSVSGSDPGPAVTGGSLVSGGTAGATT